MIITHHVQVAGRPDGMVQDLPLWWHWPKLILWVVQNGLLIWGLVYNRTHSWATLKIDNPDGSVYDCHWGDELHCSDIPQV